MRKTFVVALCAVILCSALAIPLILEIAKPASETPQPTLQPTPTASATTQGTPSSTPQASLDNAIAAATEYLAQTEHSHTLLMLDVLYRRFEIPEFKNSLTRYDEIMSVNTNNLQLRLFRRIADYNNPIDSKEIQMTTDALDEVTVPALYCDRFDLPSYYTELISNAISKGEYHLTHSLLATIWIEENGVKMPDINMDALYEDVASLIGNDYEVTDLELEAAAFLYFAGKRELVNSDFVQKIIQSQNPEGAWSQSNFSANVSNPHSTVLALTILLHVKYPSDSYPPMLAVS